MYLFLFLKFIVLLNLLGDNLLVDKNYIGFSIRFYNTSSSAIVHLMFLHHGWLRVTEAAQSGTTDEESSTVKGF